MDAAFWNGRYAVAGHVYGEEPNAFVAEMALVSAAKPCAEKNAASKTAGNNLRNPDFITSRAAWALGESFSTTKYTK